MSLADYPWKSKAINLFAPHPEEVDRFCRFIREQLIPDGIDTIVLIVRYNYAFQSHPECRGLYPLSRGDVRKMAETCRECGIRAQHEYRSAQRHAAAAAGADRSAERVF